MLKYNIFVALVLLFSVSAHAQVLEKHLPDPAQEQRAVTLFHQVRCMVCAGESIADSRASLASDMREQIRQEVASGKSDKEILSALQTAYGDKILMRPPVQANTVLLWAGPALMLLVGAFILAFKAKNTART